MNMYNDKQITFTTACKTFTYTPEEVFCFFRNFKSINCCLLLSESGKDTSILSDAFVAGFLLKKSLHGSNGAVGGRLL